MKTFKLLSLISLLGAMAPVFASERTKDIADCDYTTRNESKMTEEEAQKLDEELSNSKFIEPKKYVTTLLREACLRSRTIKQECKGSRTLEKFSYYDLCTAMEYNHRDIILNESDMQCKNALINLARHQEHEREKKIDRAMLHEQVLSGQERQEIQKHCVPDSLGYTARANFKKLIVHPEKLMQSITYEPCLNALRAAAPTIEARRKQRRETEQQRLDALKNQSAAIYSKTHNVN